MFLIGGNWFSKTISLVTNLFDYLKLVLEFENLQHTYLTYTQIEKPSINLSKQNLFHNTTDLMKILRTTQS